MRTPSSGALARAQASQTPRFFKSSMLPGSRAVVRRSASARPAIECRRGDRHLDAHALSASAAVKPGGPGADHDGLCLSMLPWATF